MGETPSGGRSERSERAVAAYRDGSLHAESFESITKDGKQYTITSGSRLGLVPHRDGVVAVRRHGQNLRYCGHLGAGVADRRNALPGPQ